MTREILINDKWPIKMLPQRSTLPSWSFWEKERLASMYSAIRPGDTVLDIGAEQGETSVLFKKWVGKDGKIILIEPVADFWPNLKANFEMNDEAPYMCFPVLVSNETTGIAAAVNVWPTEAKGEVKDDDSIEYTHLTDKPNITIMKIDEMGLPKVDVITMDIEGSEYEALQGAGETIMRDKPILFISVHPEFMWQRHHHTTDDLHVMLDKWGYASTFLGFDHEQHYMYKARP